MRGVRNGRLVGGGGASDRGREVRGENGKDYGREGGCLYISHR